METWHIYVGLIAAGCYGGFFLMKKYPGLKKVLPFIVWAAKIFQAAASTWKFKKVYSDYVQLASNYAVVLDVIAFEKDSTSTQKIVSRFVTDTYNKISDSTANPEIARRISNAVYVLLNDHKDLIEVLESLDNLKNLDVKKATLIAIDFLGELVNINNRIERLFYQDMIYGLNKILLLIKKSGGLNKKTISEVTATLWRMYQIILAFKEQNSLTALTEVQFKRKMQDTINTLLYSFINK